MNGWDRIEPPRRDLGTLGRVRFQTRKRSKLAREYVRWALRYWRKAEARETRRARGVDLEYWAKRACVKWKPTVYDARGLPPTPEQVDALIEKTRNA